MNVRSDTSVPRVGSADQVDGEQRTPVVALPL